LISRSLRATKPGSIEYAAGVTGARLVVVMGHSNCGAIEATINELQRPQANRSRNLSSIVDRIRPSVETLLETGLSQDPAAFMRFAVRSNIRARSIISGTVLKS